MVKRKRASGSSLFLMELIIAILLFCLAAAICISAFAKSHLMHRDTVMINKAVTLVQNTAETIRAGKNEEEILDNLALLYPDYISSLDGVSAKSALLNDKLTIYLDSNYNESSYSESPYSLEIECENDRDLFCAIITFNSGTKPIMDLYVEHLIN